MNKQRRKVGGEGPGLVAWALLGLLLAGWAAADANATAPASAPGSVPGPAPGSESVYMELHPVSIEPNVPENQIKVRIGTSGVLLMHVDWTKMISNYDLTGRYFGCTFNHIRENGKILDESIIEIGIFSDYNRSSLLWQGEYCTPDDCHDGLTPFLVEIDYPKIENKWEWYFKVTCDPPPDNGQKDDFVIICSVSWRVASLIGFAIGLSCLCVCVIGVIAVIIYPCITSCIRRTFLMEYKEEAHKPKKNKRKYKEAYKKKKEGNKPVVVVKDTNQIVEVDRHAAAVGGTREIVKTPEKPKEEHKEEGSAEDEHVVELEND